MQRIIDQVEFANQSSIEFQMDTINQESNLISQDSSFEQNVRFIGVFIGVKKFMTHKLLTHTHTPTFIRNLSLMKYKQYLISLILLIQELFTGHNHHQNRHEMVTNEDLSGEP